MAFLQANIYSNVSEMEVGVNVILPQETVKKVDTSTQAALTDVPVLYLSYGMGGNHSVWARKTSIERYVTDSGIAAIMPFTDLTWYTDTQYDMNYWTFISKELPKICHQLFPQLNTKREKTFAAGLSVSSYGALKLGLAKPESFATVTSLSGAISLSPTSSGKLLKVRKRSCWEGVFDPLDQIGGSIRDPLYLLQRLVGSQTKIP